MTVVAEEAKKEPEMPVVNPWDVMIWKLDSIERQVARVDQRVDRLDQRMDGLDQHIGNLENRTTQSYLILQWTAIIGFLAVIAGIVGLLIR